MEKAPATKRPRYDAAFRAEALRLASESRSTLATARAEYRPQTVVCLVKSGPAAFAC